MTDTATGETSRYHGIYADWQRDPEGFWAEQAQAIDWSRPWDKVFDPSAGVYGRWFAGAECNTCYNAVDRHVEHGRGDQAAIIYDSPITGRKRIFTYAELLREVEALAAVLRDLGVAKGDRVLIYMPMVPEAAFAMLACARLGAVHSVVFGGFAAHELATRIDDCTPKVVIAASCGIEPSRHRPLQAAARRRDRTWPSTKPEHCVVLQREEHPCDLEPGRDVDYAASVWAHLEAGTKVPCVPVAATDPLYILYTSGTTGQPKGVVRDNGGHMVALNWSMDALYGVKPGEVFWAASDVGWVVGHSYIVYGPLLHGCTTILFEGKPVGTPDAGTFWRIIEEYGVVRAVHRADRVSRHQEGRPEGRADPEIRPVELAHAVPGRRARRPGHDHLGGGQARRPGDRPLVADRDRLGHRRQPDRPRHPAGQDRLADRRHAGL